MALCVHNMREFRARAMLYADSVTWFLARHVVEVYRAESSVIAMMIVQISHISVPITPCWMSPVITHADEWDLHLPFPLVILP